ncbi:MAG TPA: PQQ-dependent sugar dehydrogenase [Jatrophihabitans sp.]|nr:PQQ-dependent sugar dehydrogenase [Jatrophihabitans sp.]
MRRALLGVPLAVTTLLAACSSSSPAVPDWRPSPPNRAIEGPGAHLQPILPIPTGRNRAAVPGSAQPPQPGASSGAAQHKGDPRVVAKHLTAPVGLALLPDGTALVGERTTGRIVRVQPQPDQPVPTVRTLHGLDTRGDGGLLDLAVSPTYLEDNLIYAYVTTRTDNRVVEFTLHGPVTPLFTGIPKGRLDNTGRIMFRPDGSLFIGTGDAGHPAAAAQQHSLAGKILHITDIGRPAPRNPERGSPVWASGQRVVDGLCVDPHDNTTFEVESGGPGAPDEINVVSKGGYYGWPRPAGVTHEPVATLPPDERAPGGCAVQFGRLWVTSLDGAALLSAPILTDGGAPRLGAFHTLLRHKYGRLRTVVAAPDGALWLTTSNKDGHGHPISTDERVIRYVPATSDLGGAQT